MLGIVVVVSQVRFGSGWWWSGWLVALLVGLVALGLGELGLGLALAELGVVVVVGAGLQVGAQALSIPQLVALASLASLSAFSPDIAPS